jgi:hypothetical protein
VSALEVVWQLFGLHPRPNMVARFRCGCLRAANVSVSEVSHARQTWSRVYCAACHFDQASRARSWRSRWDRLNHTKQLGAA